MASAPPGSIRPNVGVPVPPQPWNPFAKVPVLQTAPIAPGVPPCLLPPWEGPLLQVVESYMKGQMAYLEYRQRSDLVDRFFDLKRFMKTEYSPRTPPIPEPFA